MTPRFADPSSPHRALHLLAADGLEPWLSGPGAGFKPWVEGSGFRAGLGEVLLLPGETGVGAALVGLGDAKARRRTRFGVAAARAKLPEGAWRLEPAEPADPELLEETALGWLLAGYRFTRYRDRPAPVAELIGPDGLDALRLEAMAEAAFLAQDLINTPASDLSPAELQTAVEDLGARHGAEVTAIVGDALLEQNFPMIHTVGRASATAPRLVDLHWGDPAAPKVTIVGKGVCFDTGGLDIKPASAMALMKKDMGGAANALALAHMIMARALPVRLRLLVPAVENAISGAAFRPGDVLTSRKGLTVEVNNTDAEGRLILADALALADEETPALLLSFATLTGAARVALGTDLPACFSSTAALGAALDEAGRAAFDPLWQMPFWEPYEKKIESAVADLDNAPAGPFGGAITAALFLRRFVEKAEAFAHVDMMAWSPEDAPGRPKGGACQAARAVFTHLERRYGAAS
ncbi:MAG: leucyl aminopeptidase family protein [Pseudomonadota bacterium]